MAGDTVGPIQSGSEDLKLDGYGYGIIQNESILKVVQTTLRPIDEDFSAAVIQNDSQEPAIITHVKFEPTDIVEDIPTELAVKTFGNSTASEFSVAFDTSENTAIDRSDQGTYFRRLVKPYAIPAGDQVELRFAIKNREHIGFGLQGKLTLEYNTTEDQVIENVVVIFVGRPDAG